MTLYWVGDTDGTWNTVNNWATTSGGVGGANGAQVPTISDDTIFDVNYTTANMTCDVNIAVASLTIQGSYNGVFSFGSGYTHNSAGDMVLAGSVTVPNVTVIDCWGHFDNQNAGGWSAGSSWTLNMRGSGKNLGWTPFANLGYLNIYDDTNLDNFFDTVYSGAVDTYIAPGATLYQNCYWYFALGPDTVTVAGTIHIAANKWIIASNYLSISVGGAVTGDAGSVYAMTYGGIIENSGTFAPSAFLLQRTCLIAPGTYGGNGSFTHNANGNHQIQFQAGEYYFPGDTSFKSSYTGTYTINMTANPNITFGGDTEVQVFTPGNIAWSKGTGTLTFNGTANESIDFLDKSVENININKPSGLVTFTGNWTATSFTATAGNFDPNGKTFVTTGDYTILEGVNPLTEVPSANHWDSTDLTVGGTFIAWGSPSDQCNMQGDAGWTLNVATAGTANNVIVSGSNAAAGVPIYAKDSIDG